MIKLKNLETYLENYGKDVSRNYESFSGIDISFEVKLLGSKYELNFNLPEYWKYLEYGRRAGKRPPFDDILTWVKKKNIVGRGKMTQRSVAFVIARSIGLKGTRGKKYFSKSKEKSPNFKQGCINAFKLDLKEYKQKLIKK